MLSLPFGVVETFALRFCSGFSCHIREPSQVDKIVVAHVARLKVFDWAHKMYIGFDVKARG